MADDDDLKDVRDGVANDLTGDSDQQAVIDQSKLEEDYGTPFSPPSGVQDDIDGNHQAADTNIDPHEHYDEGIKGAAEVNPPQEPSVAGYDPPEPEEEKEERRQMA